MNKEITTELHFFIVSILWGALVLLAYDQLRILRRIIRHNSFFVAVQDLVFWVVGSVFIFAMIYVKNNGTIRGFSIMGMGIGMLIYHYILSDWIVKLISSFILLILRPLYLAIKYVTKVYVSLKRKLKIIISSIFSQLQKWVKSFKIQLSDSKQKRLHKKKSRIKKRMNNKNMKES